MSVEVGLWIQIVSGIPDSLSCILDSKPRIPDSTATFSRFLIPEKKHFPYSGIRIPLLGTIFHMVTVFGHRR